MYHDCHNTLCRFISLKEIEISTLNEARVMAVEAVCLIEEGFPRSILTSQLHLVVHLVDEIAICGTVHSRRIFFLQRFLKTLKGLCDKEHIRREALQRVG